MITKITSYYHAGNLFEIAKKAANSRSKKSDSTIIAIMFSASALEAFINESAGLARMVTSAKSQKIVDGYSSVMRELEDRKESLLVKYHMALLIFSGTTWDEGGLVFQDFKLLITIRNAIVHMKTDSWETPVDQFKRDPERTLAQYPKFINVLYEKKLIDLPAKSRSWLELVKDKRVGQWSCQVAARITAEFVKAVPDGHFKDSLREQVFVSI
jgi:hypothetical protein